MTVDYSLYLVTDVTLAGKRSLESIVEQAIAGGVTIVQLRDKEASTRRLVETAERLIALCRPIPVIVNDRVDVALAAGAAGAHVGQHDMPTARARKLLGDERILGVSVNTPQQARQAQTDGASYLGVSPIFDTPTKPDTDPATGLDELRAIRAVTDLPLVGIGGLSTGNAGEVMAAGADGIAVVSAIMAATDPRAAAEGLRRAMGSGHEAVELG